MSAALCSAVDRMNDKTTKVELPNSGHALIPVTLDSKSFSS